MSLLANTVEEFLGALYLDQGFEAAEEFLKLHLYPKLGEIQEKRLYKDAKSHLQELVQAKGLQAPEYVVVSEEGPDHDRQFTIKAMINGTEYGRGAGKSKQLAQQNAAKYVLEHLSML